MKNKIMDDDVENIGIMQGFMDSMADEGDDEGDDDEETMMERRPNSPEILMNNLRGDMRSLDARRDELADLVGYKAATETPEQVLAMLQPILAQQGGGGIGALPQSQPMAQGPQPPMMGAAPGGAPGAAPGAPPPGMPPMPGGGGAPPPPADGGIASLMAGMGGGAPGAAPGGMPPSDQPPVAMARGGYVQHFQVGSDESGVTPATDQTASEGPLLAYSPELVNAAKANVSSLISQQPTAVPTLESRVQSRLPEYQKLMGADKGMAEAQMLFELGQRAFGFAANTDEGGRRLRGGFASRLAGAVKTLPTAMGRHIESMDKIDRQIKALALQQGEKDIDQVVAQNTELLKRKTDLFKEVLKADARMQAEKIKGLGSSIFGKGDWEWNIVNMPNMMSRYADGKTNDVETNLISSAITKLRTPRTETRIDPDSKMPYTVQIVPTLPAFVNDAEAARKKGGFTVAPTPSLAPSGSAVRVESAPTAGTTSSAPGAPGAPGAAPAEGGAVVPQQGRAPATADTSLWKDRFNVAGPVAAGLATFSKIPGLGDPMAELTLARQNAELKAERLIEALLKSTAGSVKEQERLAGVINIKPSVFTDPDVYGTRLIALGTSLLEGIKEMDQQALSDGTQGRPKLTADQRTEARQRAMNYRKIYAELGLPPAVYTEAEARRYAAGTEILWQGNQLKRVKAPQQ